MICLSKLAYRLLVILTPISLPAEQEKAPKNPGYATCEWFYLKRYLVILPVDHTTADFLGLKQTAAWNEELL